jgi:2-deoxy-D-gluconate 3-dehydrogenase
MFDLSGKVAIVTGGNGGIGLGIARGLASAGAALVLVGRDAAKTERAVAELAATGATASAATADVTVEADCQGFAEAALQRHGRIDILVNNAGIIRRADLLEFSEADWDAVMTVNLKSAFFLTQAVARHMVGQGIQGRIIQVASVLSFQGGIRVPSYTAAKHGLAGLTKALANELAPKGITVNAIAPGYMDTDNTEALRADPVRTRQILDRIPVGRWGLPQDLATAALFFASPHSGYVTGTILPVDGGWLAR